MSNLYYTPTDAIQPYTTAKASDLVAEFQRIEAAFDRLPEPDVLTDQNLALALLETTGATRVNTSTGETVEVRLAALSGSYAAALNRANHTGTQAISTVSGLQAALDALSAAYTIALNRANHTGTQAIATVSGLQAALDGKAPLSVKTITDNFSYVSGQLKAAFTPFVFGQEGTLQSLWGGGFENNTNHFVGSNIGRAAIVGFSRSSDNPTVGDMATYGLGAFVEHDSNKYAWAGYDEIRRRSGAGSAHGRETAVVNFGSTILTDPYNASAANMTDVSRLSVGRSDTPTNTNVSAYQSYVKVGAKAEKGLVIASDAIVEFLGQCNAINLATTHAIQWWVSAGVTGPRIRSDTTVGAESMGLIFANSVIALQDPALNNIVIVDPNRITFSRPAKAAVYTVATLPAGAQGDMAFVTDAAATSLSSGAVVGGGVIRTPVFHNGTVWTRSQIETADVEEGTWTPTVSAFSGTITSKSASGRYLRQGKTVTAWIDITITTNGSGAGVLLFTLPHTTRNGGAAEFVGQGRDTVVGKGMNIWVAGNSNLAGAQLYDGSYPGADGRTYSVRLQYLI